MCLISKWNFPKKAKEDIICYKILRKEEYGYYTPYLDTPVKLNSTLKATGCRFRSFKNRYEVGEGYIHAYTKRYLANPVRFEEFMDDSYDYVSIKCIIPKGTKYHVSKNGFEICSRKMHLEDISIPSL